ncbi:hypothetical protein I1A62_00225 (plasmid) [Rhodococcus sp. USK10]|uniref:hypothetical protein n=1 Tax=Rhodococcus sp. USK10 TaxID=2789739 RepID=UPI001C5D3ED6|nr:hypothetical protein [Rhodococcus sp. USK10]QYA99689.1 hypothetical protein I1A62_00225 [Rhodococcus sp. USK10]
MRQASQYGGKSCGPLSRKPGRRNQNRPPKKKVAASFAGGQQPTAPSLDRDQVERELAKLVTPVVCADVGIEPLEESERKAVLANFDGEATVRAVAAIQSRLDVATTTNWTQSTVERTLLDEADMPWSAAATAKIRTNGRLIPSRSVTQLFREALEVSAPNPDVTPIPLAVILQLIVSINTEHLQGEFSTDGTLDADAITRISDMTASLNLEQSLAMFRQIMLDEIANLQSNAPLKLETLQADTHNMWFSPWPDRVTDSRLGASPAECFNTANGVELIEVLVLGSIVVERAAVGELEYSKTDLITAGASAAAVALLFDHMALPLKEFKKRLAADRRRGEIADQRYVMTQCPFVISDNGNVLLLRYQWAIDRFFGSQLYWQTFFHLGPADAGSIAEAFSLAMNDMFERAAADVLEGIIAASPSMSRLIREPEMQSSWTERAGQTPSVCDFVIPSGQACFVMDATNHHLNFKLAQGLGTVEEYSADADASLVKKCDQIAKTIRQLRHRGDFGVTNNTQFVPIVIVPVNGVPNLGSTEYDLQQRTRNVFADLALTRKIYNPTILTLPDLELIEGIAEYYGSDSRDIRDLLGGWRHQSMVGMLTGKSPLSLQDFLDGNGIQRPIPTRMFAAQRKLTAAIDARRSERLALTPNTAG